MEKLLKVKEKTRSSQVEIFKNDMVIIFLGFILPKLLYRITLCFSHKENGDFLKELFSVRECMKYDKRARGVPFSACTRFLQIRAHSDGVHKLEKRKSNCQ